MKHLFQAHTVEESARIQVLERALEEAGIPCLIRNESLAVAMGDIGCMPQAPNHKAPASALASRVARRPPETGFCEGVMADPVG